MSKRFIAALLCLVMCLSMFAGCSTKKDSDDKGAYITMYLTDEVYNFDPAYAYQNEEVESVVSLLFSRLFTLDNDGDVKGDLVSKYKIKEDEKTKEYTMEIILKNAWWSDKTKVTADDIIYAWKRILDSENSYACASLLFDIKNARAVKAGNCSIDDLGICALNDNILQISFEKPIDYDQFILNLTSLSLAPIREDYASKGEDWAKKPGTMVTSGPFKISKTIISEKKGSFADAHALLKTGEYERASDKVSLMKYNKVTYDLWVLERNPCYQRDPSEDYAIDKFVTPYRILIDCSRSDEEIWEAYQNGDIFYIGQIPMSLRTNNDVMKAAVVSDALSTQVLYLNEEAVLTNKSTKEEVKLFANADVRLALSLALDRTQIATDLVLADPATALVPNGIFEKGTSGSFRKVGGALIPSASADASAAQAALSKAGVKASDYSFSIIVNANDDELKYMANAAAQAWSALGFDVKVEERGTVANNDYYAPTDSIPVDICDELYTENLAYRDYAVMALDYCAYSADAYSLLSSFAADFSGMVDSEFNMVAHSTGYNSAEYNDLIEAIYYLNYYNQVTAADYNSFIMYESEAEFQAVLDKVKAVYDKYGIDPTKNYEANRATLLHEAEKILMADMPVIPVVFNKDATICNKKALKRISSDYYTSFFFAETSLKNYQKYVEEFDLIYTGKKGEKKK